MDLSNLRIGSPEATPSRENLVPRIKGQQWLDMVTDKMPEVQRPHCEPFVGDMYITYAFHLPGLFVTASKPHLKQVGIPLWEIRGIAIENLKKDMETLKIDDYQWYCSITAQKNLAACAMLFDDVWKPLAKKFPNELVACVPTRDLILFCDSKSAIGMKALDDLGTEFFDEDDQRISKSKFVWRNDKWEEYTPVEG